MEHKYRIGDKIIVKDKGYSFYNKIAIVHNIAPKAWGSGSFYSIVLPEIKGKDTFWIHPKFMILCTVGEQLLFDFMKEA